MEFLDSLEYKLYDIKMNLRGDPESQSSIALVDIDEDSIEKLGRWPWPRSLLTEGIKKINKGKPKVIGLNIILSEPEKNLGLKEIENLEKLFTEPLLSDSGDIGLTFLNEMSASQERLDNDKILAESIKEAGNVILPVFFKESAIAAEETSETDEAVNIHAIQNIQSAEGMAWAQANEIVLPIPAFLDNSDGIGHINLAYDMDGTVRRERSLYEYNGLFIPSYTIRLAANYLNIPFDKIQADLGSTIYLGSLEIPGPGAQNC